MNTEAKISMNHIPIANIAKLITSTSNSTETAEDMRKSTFHYMYKQIVNLFKQIGNLFKHISNLFKQIKNLFKKISNLFEQINNMFEKITNLLEQIVICLNKLPICLHIIVKKYFFACPLRGSVKFNTCC